MTLPVPRLPDERVQIIDLIRGIDIVLMVLFNYSVTLRYFGLIGISTDYIYWSAFPVIIASIFIFLSGVASYASFEHKMENFGNRYFKRGAKLLVFAALITLFTRAFVPEGTVYFGILHFFALSSFFVPLFIRYGRLNLTAGLLIILLGSFLQMKVFDFPYLLWLGFTPGNFATFDYFPLMPWLGVLLLGIFSGKRIIERTAGINFKGKPAGIFMYLGRNSLTVYLIHQPLLILILIVSGFRVFS